MKNVKAISVFPVARAYQKTADIALFAALLAQRSEMTDAWPLAARLCKIAELSTKLRRRYVNGCNHVWATTDRYNEGTEVLRTQIKQLCAQLPKPRRGKLVTDMSGDGCFAPVVLRIEFTTGRSFELRLT